MERIRRPPIPRSPPASRRSGRAISFRFPPGPTVTAKATASSARSLPNNPDKSPPRRLQNPRPRTASGPPRQNINIRMSFPRGSRIPIREPNPQKAGRRNHRPSPTPTYGTTPWAQEPEFPLHGRKAKERENHPCLRPQSQPLASQPTGSAPCAPAWVDVVPGQSTTSSTNPPEDELFPVCQELNIGVNRPASHSMKAASAAKMTLETPVPRHRLGVPNTLAPRTSATPSPRVEKLKHLLPAGMTPAANGLSASSCHNPAVSTTIVGHAQTRTRPRKTSP